ncbi:hypothetical protein Vafri_1172 [Volvox africanus]|nr:hypothetical protein Vafri_1172 [Volvox africanus]
MEAPVAERTQVRNGGSVQAARAATDIMEVDMSGAGSSQQQQSRYLLWERKRFLEECTDGQQTTTVDRVNAAVTPGIPEPNTYTEAMTSMQAEEWHRAMDEEIEAQLANGTWELAKPPPGAKLLPCMSLGLQSQADGSVERFKARLVAKGYEQRVGIDYGELFAPTSRFASLRVLLAVAAAKKMIVHQSRWTCLQRFSMESLKKNCGCSNRQGTSRKIKLWHADC